MGRNGAARRPAAIALLLLLLTMISTALTASNAAGHAPHRLSDIIGSQALQDYRLECLDAVEHILNVSGDVRMLLVEYYRALLSAALARKQAGESRPDAPYNARTDTAHFNYMWRVREQASVGWRHTSRLFRRAQSIAAACEQQLQSSMRASDTLDFIRVPLELDKLNELIMTVETKIAEKMEEYMRLLCDVRCDFLAKGYSHVASAIKTMADASTSADGAERVCAVATALLDTYGPLHHKYAADRRSELLLAFEGMLYEHVRDTLETLRCRLYDVPKAHARHELLARNRFRAAVYQYFRHRPSGQVSVESIGARSTDVIEQFRSVRMYMHSLEHGLDECITRHRELESSAYAVETEQTMLSNMYMSFVGPQFPGSFRWFLLHVLFIEGATQRIEHVLMTWTGLNSAKFDALARLPATLDVLASVRQHLATELLIYIDHSVIWHHPSLASKAGRIEAQIAKYIDGAGIDTSTPLKLMYTRKAALEELYRSETRRVKLELMRCAREARTRCSRAAADLQTDVERLATDIRALELTAVDVADGCRQAKNDVRLLIAPQSRRHVTPDVVSARLEAYKAATVRRLQIQCVRVNRLRQYVNARLELASALGRCDAWTEVMRMADYEGEACAWLRTEDDEDIQTLLHLARHPVHTDAPAQRK